MDYASQASQLVIRIDAQLAELENERQVVLRVHVTSQTDYEDVRNRTSDAYSTALKTFAKGDAAAAHRELAEVNDKLEAARVGLLAESIEKSVSHIERTVTSFLWLGERGNYLQATDKIQRKTRELAGRSPSAVLPQLVGHLNELGALQRQLTTDERQLRSRLPVQVLLWGLPIVIGFWASDKFTTRQNLTLLAILVVGSVVVYLVLRFRVLSKLAPVRGLRNILRSRELLSYVYLPLAAALAIPLILILPPVIDELVTTKQMVLNTGTIPAPVAPGVAVRIPYHLSYNGESVATGVKVSVNVPGLGSCLKEYSALAQSHPASGECVLNVASDATPGTYSVEIVVIFTARRWLPMPMFSEYSSRTIKHLSSLTIGGPI